MSKVYLPSPATSPLVVAVTGARNSGKTTAVAGLVTGLGRSGLTVATIKHCHHGFEVDRPGKDSWRHREAGAAGTALMGPEGTVVMRFDPEQDPVNFAARAFPEADVVIAEGFHWLPLPRIEVEGGDGVIREAHPRGRVLERLAHRFGEAEIETACRAVLRLLDEQVSIRQNRSQKGQTGKREKERTRQSWTRHPDGSSQTEPEYVGTLELRGFVAQEAAVDATPGPGGGGTAR